MTAKDSRRLRSFVRVVVALAMMVMIASAVPNSVGAHNYGCGRQHTANNELYRISSGVQATVNAFQTARARINNANNAFTWTQTSSTSPSISLLTSYNLGSPSTAGQAIFYYTPNGSTNCAYPGDLLRVTAVLNSGHGWTNQQDRECAAIHEMYHGMGFAHNGSSTSVLWGPGQHSNRCHSNPVLFPSAHDNLDGRDKYE